MTNLSQYKSRHLNMEGKGYCSHFGEPLIFKGNLILRQVASPNTLKFSHNVQEKLLVAV